MNPIGILGGTFDPIHYAHLRLAEEAADQLDLASVRFIPAGQPYHRGSQSTDATHRLAMTRIALTDNPRFILDERDVGREAPSFTVETLNELRAELGKTVPLVMLMGTDAFRTIASWYHYKEIFSLAHIAILTRAGTAPDWLNAVEAELRAELRGRLVTHTNVLHEGPAGCIISLPMTPLEISATRIRALMRNGQSPRYLLPPQVLDYIESHRLYTATVAPQGG